MPSGSVYPHPAKRSAAGQDRRWRFPWRGHLALAKTTVAAGDTAVIPARAGIQSPDHIMLATLQPPDSLGTAKRLAKPAHPSTSTGRISTLPP